MTSGYYDYSLINDEGSTRLLVVNNAISHQEQRATLAVLVKADSAYVTSLLPVGNGEFLAVKADQAWSQR